MAEATTRSKSSKRKKVEHFPDKDTVVDDGTDRISNLPDSLLCHVLSFLPTINAVATTILSSRWKSLWTLVPTLYLDDGSISRRLFRCRTNSAVEPISFTHVVSRVLALHIAPLLRNFSLAICSPCHPFHIDTWINTAIARNVQQLLLKIYLNGDSRGEFYDGELCELPRSFYTFKTVVVLKLTGGILIDPPPSFQLPSLKILTLNKISYKNDESLSRLFSSCPVLETLRVSRDCKDGMIDLKISVPTLKHLDLDFNSYEPGLPDYKLEIYSPALGYFRFQGDLRNVVFLEKLSNLVEAQVDIHAIANPDNYWDYKYEIFYGDRVFKLLKALNNAKFLSLYPGEEKCFGFGSIYPSRFQNLVRLKFDVKKCNWHVLQALLLES